MGQQKIKRKKLEQWEKGEYSSRKSKWNKLLACNLAKLKLNDTVLCCVVVSFEQEVSYYNPINKWKFEPSSSSFFLFFFYIEFFIGSDTKSHNFPTFPSLFPITFYTFFFHNNNLGKEEKSVEEKHDVIVEKKKFKSCLKNLHKQTDFFFEFLAPLFRILNLLVLVNKISAF